MPAQCHGRTNTIGELLINNASLVLKGMTLALSATYQPGDSTWPLLLENFVIDMDGMAEKIEKK